MGRHDYHFVRNREFWTLYWTMVVAALAWGGFWAVMATHFFKLNHQALTFLVEHIPQKMHLVITSREDPALPVARLRARHQLTELRAADLRFTPAEASELAAFAQKHSLAAACRVLVNSNEFLFIR